MLSDFEKVQDRRDSVCVCVSICLSVTSHISETSEAVTMKVDKVTVLVMRMYHASMFSSHHLELWPHEHVLQGTGQCMSRRMKGTRNSIRVIQN